MKFPLLSFLLWWSIPLMGQIKVATIGAVVPSFSHRTDWLTVVDEIERYWDRQLQQVLPDRPDLILLPEFFDIPSSFSPKTQKEYIQAREDRIVRFVSEKAKQHSCYIAFGTLLLDEKGLLRNAAILIDRYGKLAGVYYKNFPTIGEMEGGIVAGNEAPVFQCDFGTVGMVICFDLNFEELRDRMAEQHPDILLFPSMYHGGHMQRNWAYACRSFFIGAISGAGTRSEIRDPLGEVVASSSNYNNYAITEINLNSKLVHLGYNEGKLKALKAKYGHQIQIKDPGNLGAVLVTSLDPNRPIDTILKEFDIENMHDYYNRSRSVRANQIKSMSY